MHRKRGKWLWPLATALALIALPSFAGEKDPSESKVAAVSGSVITQDDFNKEMARVQQVLAKSGRSFDDSQLLEIKKEVLESLIKRELLYQESQNKGVKVEEAALNEQIESMRKRFSTEAELKSALSRMNLTEADVKSEIERLMAIQKFIDEQIFKKVTVSEEESRAYYESHPDLFKKPEQVLASHILIKVDPKAEESKKTEARKTLETIMERLKKGEDFAELAKEFSQDPSSSKGGDLGYFGQGQMVKPFEEAAFALKTGEVSGVVETKFGYHLIKVFDKKDETTMAYEEIKDRLQEHLKQEKVKEQLNQYVEELKGKAKIERFQGENP